MGHLKSPAFFNVDSFPTTSLKITSVDGNMATADLTVRGRTNSEKITDIAIIQNADGTVSATGKLTFDRKKYGANWDYPPGDMVLKNDIELTVDLVGKAQ
jgi:polyisoprenoid-binding protein YceI